MPPILLTAAFVAHTRADQRRTYFDAKARGLVLRVSPSGVKSYFFVYRVRGGGPVRWLSLGHADTLSLSEARTLAVGYRYAVDVERRDPVAERKAAESARRSP